jgi:predicted RNase H-like HicB family nuclease
MDRYIYPAIFEHDDEGYTITFPDLPGCITCGENLEQAYLMAKDALELHLFGMEQDNDEIPRPSEPEKVKLETTLSSL